MIWFIIIVFLIIILITLIVVINKENNIVVNTSTRLEKLFLLNRTTKFDSYNVKLSKLSMEMSSLKKYRQFEASDVVLYFIENNIESFRDDLEILIGNMEIYDMYIKFCESYKDIVSNKVLEDISWTLEKYIKVENRVFKKYMHKQNNAYNIKVITSYTSPGGRNRYINKERFLTSEVLKIYYQWKKQSKFKVSSKLERMIMNDSMRYDVLKRDNFQCQICGSTKNDGAKLHVDHIVPVSKGGKSIMSNLQTLCDRCNIGKSNKAD